MIARLENMSTETHEIVENALNLAWILISLVLAVAIRNVLLSDQIDTVALIVLTNTGGGSNLSFMIALTLTVLIYLCSYFLLFLGYLHLVLKQPEKKRVFNVPGGKKVKVIVATSGLIISILAFVISFVPPSSLPASASLDAYLELLVVSFLVVVSIPFIVYAVHKKHDKTTNATLQHIKHHNAPEGHFFIHPRARSTHHFHVHEDNDKE